VCLFSAIIPDWVKDIAREHMKQDFCVVDLAQNFESKTPKNIRHLAIEVEYRERLDVLTSASVILRA